jgi:hypothetical protein
LGLLVTSVWKKLSKISAMMHPYPMNVVGKLCFDWYFPRHTY